MVFAAGLAESNTVKHKLVNTNPSTPNTAFEKTKSAFHYEKAPIENGVTRVARVAIDTH